MSYENSVTFVTSSFFVLTFCSKMRRSVGPTAPGPRSGSGKREKRPRHFGQRRRGAASAPAGVIPAASLSGLPLQRSGQRGDRSGCGAARTAAASRSGKSAAGRVPHDPDRLLIALGRIRLVRKRKRGDARIPHPGHSDRRSDPHHFFSASLSLSYSYAVRTKNTLILFFLTICAIGV